MSERQVLGFVVAPELLWALVGSGLAPDGLIDDAAGEVAELDYHLARSWPGMTAERLATDVLAGRLDEEHAGDVVRLLPSLLDSVAQPVYGEHAIWIQDTMTLAWRPTLTALGLPTLAAHWATANIAWPWPRDTRPRVSWPIVTELPPAALTGILTELGSGTADPAWRSALAALPDDALVDPDGAPVDDPEDVREELTDCLEQLTGWVELALGTPPADRRCVAPHGNSLLLVMDGDQ